MWVRVYDVDCQSGSVKDYEGDDYEGTCSFVDFLVVT